MKLITYFLIALFVLISIDSYAVRKPKWVKERPNDSNYYLGIGMAEKSGVENQYVTKARSYALKQMSSEIKVSVSSNSILTQFENNYDLKEEFESKVQTSVTQTLEGYEVETWENKHEYWVMMRLSKDKYERNRKLALDKDKKLAASYYYSAEQSKGNGKVFEAFSYYVKAIKCIKNHLEEDLAVRDINGELNLGVDIVKGIQDAFSRIHLTPEHDIYSIHFSQQMQYPLTIHASYKGAGGELNPVENLPIEFYFSKGEGILSNSSATNHSGVAKCSINRFISKRRLQEVTGVLKLSSLFNDEDESYTLLKLFFPKESLPKVIISLEVAKAKAYLISDESIFGRQSKSGPFTTMLKSSLNDNFFTFTPNIEEAKFVIQLMSEFVAGEEKKGSGYSVFIVYSNFSLAIMDATTKVEIFSDGASSIKGMLPGGFEHAIKNCRQKSMAHFENAILPKLEQVDM